MVQCEMCGTETSSPKTVKVEGAELQVCEECAGFGTEVETESSETTSTKYSTSSDSDTDTSSSPSGGSRRQDMFDEMDEVAPDYDQRIRQAREAADLSQEDLADEVNEKASLVRKLERGDVLPSDEVQGKLERRLDISLVESEGGDADWESETAGDGLTLGDMVKRKD
jgi:putative transcription factor